jgi:cobalt/nickel transport system permease protein
MHLGNGAITPECVALTAGAAAAGLSASAAAIRTAKLTPDKLLMAVGLGCLVLAAQAINVPVAPGISAHLVGGVLLAWLLGPGLGAWTMALVLAVQAMLLGDGGLAALGANVLNMALLPAAVVTITRRISSSEGMHRSHAALPVAAGAAVALAALLIVAEIALFRSGAELTGWTNFAALMIGTHAWAGVIEGGLTVVVVAALQAATTRTTVLPSASARALVGVAAGLLIAALLLPISSALPDGYEAAAQASGMSWLLRR